jgi:hypothetical protein
MGKMEFLVRTEDKINTQVICFNPEHKDRIAFEDATFKAFCPICKSEEFLFRKNNAISKKGHFIAYKPDGWPWGENERKHFGIIRIDCTEAEAQEWCKEVGKFDTTDIKALVEYRSRKYALDIESTLTPTELASWKNMETESSVKILSSTANIKVAL